MPLRAYKQSSALGIQNPENYIDDEREYQEFEPVMVKVSPDKVKGSPYNRTIFQINDIEKLADTLLFGVGMITIPTVFGPDGNGDYILLSGERRVTAVRFLLGLKNLTSEEQHNWFFTGSTTVPATAEEMKQDLTEELEKIERKFSKINVYVIAPDNGLIQNIQEASIIIANTEVRSIENPMTAFNELADKIELVLRIKYPDIGDHSVKKAVMKRLIRTNRFGGKRTVERMNAIRVQIVVPELKKLIIASLDEGTMPSVRMGNDIAHLPEKRQELLFEQLQQYIFEKNGRNVVSGNDVRKVLSEMTNPAGSRSEVNRQKVIDEYFRTRGSDESEKDGPRPDDNKKEGPGKGNPEIPEDDWEPANEEDDGMDDGSSEEDRWNSYLENDEKEIAAVKEEHQAIPASDDYLRPCHGKEKVPSAEQYIPSGNRQASYADPSYLSGSGSEGKKQDESHTMTAAPELSEEFTSRFLESAAEGEEKEKPEKKADDIDLVENFCLFLKNMMLKGSCPDYLLLKLMSADSLIQQLILRE